MNGGENQNELIVKISENNIDNNFLFDLEKRRLEIISNIVIRMYKDKICEC